MEHDRKRPGSGSPGSLREQNDKADAIVTKHQTPVSGNDEALDRRRLKKRESDRNCQRISRQRKKSRVMYLENLVDQLKEADKSGQVDKLLQKITQLQSERDSFEQKLMAIEGILRPARTHNSAHPDPGIGLPETSPKANVETGREASATLSGPSISGGKNDSPSDSTSFLALEIDKGATLHHPRSLISNIGLATHEAKVQNEALNTRLDNGHLEGSKAACHRPYLGTPYPTVSTQNASLLSGHSCGCGLANAQKMLHRSIWYHGNITLGAWMNWPSLASAYPDADPYHEDTSVRAVVEGWDSIEHRGNVHPIWRLMRRMDESLFKYSENSTMRLSILYGVSRLILAHIDQSNELYNKLPPHLREGPTQKTYAYATNFPAWPGIRRALSLNEHRYCSNHFWHKFINSMRMRWPFEFRDCYRYNKSKASYSLSPTYLELENDLHASGVTRDFFEYYPEFRGMIAAVDEIPPSLVMNMPDFHERAAGPDSMVLSAQNQRPFFPFDIRGQMGLLGGGEDLVMEPVHNCQDTTERNQSIIQQADPITAMSPAQDPSLPFLLTGTYKAVENGLTAGQGDTSGEVQWLHEEEGLAQMSEWSTSLHSTFFPDRDFL